MNDMVERLRGGLPMEMGWYDPQTAQYMSVLRMEAAAEIERLCERVTFLTQRIGQFEALFGETYGRNNSSLSSGKGADASARPPPWASD